MKKFILKTTLFLLATPVVLLLLVLLPSTPRASRSPFFSELKKDSLLINEKSPRIIFVGGSNVGFGLNSQTIKDTFHVNPINDGIGAPLGLKYMLDNICRYAKERDIIIVIPEYLHFYNEYNLGSETLLRLILDVNKSKISLLNTAQIINCSRYIGTLALSKLNPTGYIRPVNENQAYTVNGYNQYGDVFAHWNMERIAFEPYDINIEAYDPDVMKGLKEFEQKIRRKGAIMYVSYPSYQDIAFDKSLEAIRKVETEYRRHDFIVLGTPDRYRMHDSLMYDTSYHLNKTGVDYRTELLIEDLKVEFTSAKHIR